MQDQFNFKPSDSMFSIPFKLIIMQIFYPRNVPNVLAQWGLYKRDNGCINHMPCVTFMWFNCISGASLLQVQPGGIQLEDGGGGEQRKWVAELDYRGKGAE